MNVQHITFVFLFSLNSFGTQLAAEGAKPSSSDNTRVSSTKIDVIKFDPLKYSPLFSKYSKINNTETELIDSIDPLMKQLYHQKKYTEADVFLKKILDIAIQNKNFDTLNKIQATRIALYERTEALDKALEIFYDIIASKSTSEKTNITNNIKIAEIFYLMSAFALCEKTLKNLSTKYPQAAETPVFTINNISCQLALQNTNKEKNKVQIASYIQQLEKIKQKMNIRYQRRSTALKIEILINLGEFEKANNILKENRNPINDQQKLKELEATILCHQNKTKEASEVLKSIEGSLPQNWPSAVVLYYYKLGFALQLAQDFEGSKKFLNKAQIEFSAIESFIHKDSVLRSFHDLSTILLTKNQDKKLLKNKLDEIKLLKKTGSADCFLAKLNT